MRKPRGIRYVSATLTRPNNTTAYAAGDAISDSASAPTAQTIQVGKIDGDAGFIHVANLIDSNKAATPADLDVWIFEAAYTPTNDNAAFDLSDAEALNVIAIIEFDTAGAHTTASNRVFHHDTHGIPFKCVSGTKNLYWAVVCGGTLTPIANETFTLKLGITED